MERIALLLVVLGLLTTVSPAAALAAPPAQGGLIAKVSGLWIQLYQDSQLQALGVRVWQGTFLELGESCGNARYVQAFTLQPQVDRGVLQTVRNNVAEGWMDSYILTTGQVYFLPGAYLPPEFVVGAAQGMQSLTDCQIWLECNGYSNAGTGPVWSWLDRSGVLTTHPEDCIPYRNAPRPPGCYP